MLRWLEDRVYEKSFENTSDIPSWRQRLSDNNQSRTLAVEAEARELRIELARLRSAQAFREHLKSVNRMVSKWPSWKRKL